MEKPAKIIFGVLVAVVLINLFLVVQSRITGPVAGSIILVTNIALLYICIRLNLKFHNPYFKMMAVSYGLGSAISVFFSLAGLARWAGYVPILSLGGSVPLSVSFYWFNAFTVFLVTCAAILYRERWEEDEGASVMERFFTLVPAAKTNNFWLVLIEAPLVYNAIRQLIYFHIQEVSYHVPFNGHWSIPTGIMDVLTQTIILILMLLVVILNLSLFRIHRIQFFRYMYIISLVTVIYSVVWRLFSLYTGWLLDWSFRPPSPGKSHAFTVLSHIDHLSSLIAATYGMAVPIATLIVFLYYAESRGGEPTPAP